MSIFKRSVAAMLGTSIVVLAGGCKFNDDTPPPLRASIPPPGTYTIDRTPMGKPLPERGGYDAPFDDAPMLTQPTPEQAAFVQAYAQVGSPRIAVYVNRTVDATTIITADAGAGRVDFQAVENIMTDWLAADGKVVMVSPVFGESLPKNPQQTQVLSSLAKEPGIDVLVYVQARETTQTGGQKSIRLVAEAINTRGGESLARAVLDVPPMLDKPIINDATRFLARKLMNDMTRAWQNMPAPRATTQPG